MRGVDCDECCDEEETNCAVSINEVDVDNLVLYAVIRQVMEDIINDKMAEKKSKKKK